MKAFYTKKELEKMTEDELLSITSFSGGNNVYYYENITKLSMTPKEFVISFKSGEEVYTQSKEVFDSIKMGKARYDVLMKSLEEVQREQEIREEFMREIKSEISSQMSEVHSQINTNRQNFENMTKYIQEQTNKDIKSLSKTVSDTMEKWNSKLDTLNSVDVDKFEKMMKQMETIADAFEILMKD